MKQFLPVQDQQGRVQKHFQTFTIHDLIDTNLKATLHTYHRYINIYTGPPIWFAVRPGNYPVATTFIAIGHKSIIEFVILCDMTV